MYLKKTQKVRWSLFLTEIIVDKDTKKFIHTKSTSRVLEDPSFRYLGWHFLQEWYCYQYKSLCLPCMWELIGRVLSPLSQLFHSLISVNKMLIGASNMKIHKWLFRHRFRLLKFLSLVVCIGLFVHLTVDVVDKYFKEMTSVGTVSEGSDIRSKFLPCMTLCPWQGD